MYVAQSSAVYEYIDRILLGKLQSIDYPLFMCGAGEGGGRG